jgi:hypothetical protein
MERPLSFQPPLLRHRLFQLDRRSLLPRPFRRGFRGHAPAGLDGPRHAILRRGKTCRAGVPAQDLRAARRAIVHRLLVKGLHLHRGAPAGVPDGDGAVRLGAGRRHAARGGPAPGAVVRRGGDGVSRRASRGGLRLHICR